jgi:hypothetical protein
MKFRLQAIVAILALAGFGAVHAQSVTRAQVNAEFKTARAAGQLHRNDWYDELAARPAPGTDETRTDVIAKARAARTARGQLKGPLRDRSYNPWQVEIFTWRSDLYARSEIRNEELTARAEHLLVPAGEAPLPISSVQRHALYASN